MTRKAVGAKRRFEIFKRDEFTCQYCGAHPPAAILHVDHITPVAKGGQNDSDNLITACNVCNAGKGARSLDSVPQSLKDKAAETAEREAQVRGYAKVMAAKRSRIEDDAWQVANIFIDQFGDQTKRSIRRDYFQSIKRFIDELGVHECIEAIERAIAKQPRNESLCFRYFCGTCWRIIKGTAQ